MSVATDEATYGEANAPEREVLILDTTLRDGEQSAGVCLNPAEKLRIAEQLAQLGVDAMEAGFPVGSLEDLKAVQQIARTLEGPVISVLARAYKQDIDAGWNAVRDAVRPRINVFASTSDIHIDHQLKSTRDSIKGQVRAGVAYARERLDDVEFSPMDATRSSIEFMAEVLQIAIDEGASTITIPDTVGYAMPHEYAELLERLYALVPDLRHVTLSVHCHDDLGLATANSLAGVIAGARQVHCTVNGIGERAGNTSLEEFVMLLRTRRAQLGFDTRLNTREIMRTSTLVSQLTGVAVAPNKAIVGSNAFAHESGIHQDGVLKEPATYEIIDPISVGVRANSIVLGKHSGRHAVHRALEELGVSLAAQDFLDLFSRFKQFASTGRTVTTSDLRQLVADMTKPPDRQ